MLRKQIFKNYKSEEEFFTAVKVSFFIFLFFSYRWKSFDRFLIHMFHLYGWVDLKKTRSVDVDITNVLRFFQDLYPKKITKKDLREILKLSNNSFNKKFKSYLISNNLVGRKKYDIEEGYGLISYWCGEGDWGRLKGFKKQELADKITSGNIKELRNELKLYTKWNKENSISDDILPPKFVRSFLDHQGYTNEEIAEFTT